MVHFIWAFEATKAVFRVSDKARLKPVSSATETSYKIESSLVATLDMILSKKQITKGADQTAREPVKLFII